MQKQKLLEFDVVNKPDSIEKLFCEKFEKLKSHPLDEETAKFLMILGFSSKTLLSDIANVEVPFLCQLISKRILVSFDYTIEDDRAIVILSQVAQTPGKAVMYLWYLQYYCKKNNIKSIDLTILCTRIFPNGFPSNEDLSELWKSQKINKSRKEDSDNLLDYQSAGESIYF